MGQEIRGDIQGLRALAVLTVIAGHAGVPFLPGGFVGVDVFFVISGYLISGLLFREVLGNGRFSLTTFYARRARRILPAATLVTVVTVVGSLVVLSLIDARQVVLDAVWSALFAANFNFAAAGRLLLLAGQWRLPDAALLVARGRGAVLRRLAAAAARSASASSSWPGAGAPTSAGCPGARSSRCCSRSPPRRSPGRSCRPRRSRRRRTSPPSPGPGSSGSARWWPWPRPRCSARSGAEVASVLARAGSRRRRGRLHRLHRPRPPSPATPRRCRSWARRCSSWPARARPPRSPGRCSTTR